MSDKVKDAINRAKFATPILRKRLYKNVIIILEVLSALFISAPLLCFAGAVTSPGSIDFIYTLIFTAICVAPITTLLIAIGSVRFMTPITFHKSYQQDLLLSVFLGITLQAGCVICMFMILAWLG